MPWPADGHWPANPFGLIMMSDSTKPVRISYRSPWQNGTAERWIGNCRRELLEHVVVLGERHLVRLVRTYVSYYHEDRCHLGLEKDTPNERLQATARDRLRLFVASLQKARADSGARTLRGLRAESAPKPVRDARSPAHRAFPRSEECSRPFAAREEEPATEKPWRRFGSVSSPAHHARARSPMSAARAPRRCEASSTCRTRSDPRWSRIRHREPRKTGLRWPVCHRNACRSLRRSRRGLQASKDSSRYEPLF